MKQSLRAGWRALIVALALPVAAASAQSDTTGRDSTAAQQAYQSRRAQLMAELQDMQAQLSEVRNQRLELQARIENAVAQNMSERAKQLMMSDEQTALQQLDAMLTTAQDNLISQRDRMTSLADAVKRRTGAVLVVMLRADSSQAQTLSGAELQVDNAVTSTRTYSAVANSALAAGAVDEVYRSSVLPTSHLVQLSVTVNGAPVTQSVTVSTGSDAITYVQFAMRNGALVPTTWTSKGTTPF